MHSTVKQLRHRGARRSLAEIEADPGTAGQLTLALCGASYELKLHQDDGSRMESVIPIQFDAVIVSIKGDKMLYRGVEKNGEDGPDYRQEWLCCSVLPETPNLPASR